MSIKKRQRLLFHLILFTLFVLIIGGNFDHSAASTGRIVSGAKAPEPMWQLNTHHNMYAVTTSANALAEDWAHELSYIMSGEDCSQPAIKLTLSGSFVGQQSLVGDTVRLNVFLGERRAMIQIPIISIESSESGMQVDLARFLLNQNMYSDLLAHQEMIIDVLEPLELAQQLKHRQISFALTGLADANKRLRQLCQSPASSYRLSHGVL